MRRITVLAGLFVTFSLAANAQNLSSPYSVYGVGDIQNSYPDRSAGMANASLSLISSPGFLLNKNPASLIGLERSLGQLDLALTGKTVTFKGEPITSSNSSGKDVVIKRFGVSAKLNNWWASGFGFMPYSYVNYQFVGQKSIEGSTNTFEGTYEGNGGLNQVFWTNAFAVGKHVAMGLRSSFIFGSINQTETLAGATLNVPIVSQTSTYYNNFRFEYGAIYKGKINKNWVLGLGGKITTKTGLNTDETLTVTEGSTAVETNKQLSTGTYNLPWSYEGGISLINKNKTTFSVDYSFDQWQGVKNTVPTSTYALVNSQRVSAGFQISNQIQRFNLVAEKSYFQAGVFAGQSYLQVKGQQLNEFGVTAGYGGYLSRGLNFSLGLEAGRRGTTANNLVRENYIQLTLAFSYREFLASKGRKYD
jgi:hypothetical protein